MELTTAMGAGWVGGLILNIMPCVLPVLFFKVQGLVHSRDASARERRRDGLAYLLGTWVVFGAFAALMITIRASGKAMGWGMQMQNPAFVGFVVTALFLFGLNSLGVFELYFTVSGGHGQRGGFTASFVDGALITLVSTPCSAPFLGTAATAALAMDTAWWETLLLFVSVGTGLSTPILLISFVPGANRLLPRPGNWMNVFKALTGVTLMGAAVWFFESLQKQVTPESANRFLWFLLALGLLARGYQVMAHQGYANTKRRLIMAAGLVGLTAMAVGFIRFEAPAAAGPVTTAEIAAATAVPSSVQADKIVWTAFNGAVKTQAAAIGRPIFVDFTADWCASCKTFEKSHIETEGVRAALDKTRILAAKADLTGDVPELWEALNKLGRNGLPTYVIYKPDGTHDLLPEGPPSTLVQRLEAASADFPPAKFTQ
jgi:thiol:disulfide interchange protein